MTYDEWKAADENRAEHEPNRCIHLFEMDEHCPDCDGPVEPE